MDRRTFLTRSETFGLDTDSPWALDALRLLFAVPRLYGPLARAWEGQFPGTQAALARLVRDGFIAHQGGVVVDTRTGAAAAHPTRPARRFRITSRGRRLAEDSQEDLRVFEEAFPRCKPENTLPVVEFLTAFDLDDAQAKSGVSLSGAMMLMSTSGVVLPESNAKWWLARFLAEGHLKELPFLLADTREVVPEHYRITRALCRQLANALDAFREDADALKAELRVRRSRFLGPIEPTRVGISGATDYDHDVNTQRVLADMLGSPRALVDGVFQVEPRITLELDRSTVPFTFRAGGGDPLFYQPDAEFREANPEGGVPVRTVLEYERFQSRRDAWSHIERFLGYLAQRALPFEPAVLRFVVDGPRREATYVQLALAFADYLLDHPERVPPNPTTIAVSTTERLAAVADPLDMSAWFRVALPASGRADTGATPVLHHKKKSPYDAYFSRSGSAGS